MPRLLVAAQEICRRVTCRDRFHGYLRGQPTGRHGVGDAAAGQRVHLPGRITDQHQSISDQALGRKRDGHVAGDQGHGVALGQGGVGLDEAGQVAQHAATPYFPRG